MVREIGHVLRDGLRAYELRRPPPDDAAGTVVNIRDIVAARLVLRPLLADPRNVAVVRALPLPGRHDGRPRSDADLLERLAHELVAGRWLLTKRQYRAYTLARPTRSTQRAAEERDDGDAVEPIVADPPYFRCNELSGTHFDFGRSFVRRDAVETLARIVEELNGEPDRKAMIFAHTDRSGSEALNKELSERRARAVYALFTHDDDAWEELFTNKSNGGHWSEQWGTREVQHMLKALSCRDDAGEPLGEHGRQDAATTQAIKRFQRGEYPCVPAEQAPLADDGVVGPKTRKELFLAYAKRISRTPLPADRLTTINGAKYMGCGEFNPLSKEAKDQQSRRTVVFVFDPRVEPRGLPCKLGSLKPCKANLGPPPAGSAGSPHYRCQVYQELAIKCPCRGGPDLSHDLILQLPFTLEEADRQPHVFVIESEDGTITQSRRLAVDARAEERGFVELYFPDLPPHHSYRLRCEGTDDPHLVFDLTPYEELFKLAADPLADDPSPLITELPDLDDDPPEPEDPLLADEPQSASEA